MTIRSISGLKEGSIWPGTVPGSSSRRDLLFGKYSLNSHPQPIQMANTPPSPNLFFRPAHTTIYELVGGMVTFRKLAEAFYKRIELDPLLRPMFPKKLHHAIDRQALFLAQ